MNFDIDISGEDLLKKDYSICVCSSDEKIILGYKFDKDILQILKSRLGQNFYRYSCSQKDKANFKVRLYCIAIYCIFKQVNPKARFSLRICSDFDGKQEQIRQQLINFLSEKLQLNITGNELHFEKIEKGKTADKYAFLMNKDTSNKLSIYIKIKLENFEEWLKK